MFFFLFLTIWLPWQPAKLSCLHKFHVVGLFKKHFCKNLVEISAVISQYMQMSMATLSCHSNHTAKAMAVKTVFL